MSLRKAKQNKETHEMRTEMSKGKNKLTKQRIYKSQREDDEVATPAGVRSSPDG